MVRKTRIVWPLLVIRSICFSAWVTQITAVSVVSPARNADVAVRNRYRSMRNIGGRGSRQADSPAASASLGSGHGG